MHKKHFSLLLILIMFAAQKNIKAQSKFQFKNSIGPTFVNVWQNKETKQLPGLTLGLRLDYTLNNETSFSLASYLCGAYNGNIAINTPLILQYNFGNKASSASRSKYGYFLGFGYCGTNFNDIIIQGISYSCGLNFGRKHTFCTRIEFVDGKSTTFIKTNNVLCVNLLYYFKNKVKTKVDKNEKK